MVAICHQMTKTQLDRFNRNFLQCWLIHPEVTQAYRCLDMFIVSRWQWAAPFVCRHNHKVQEAVRSILRYSLPWKMEQKSKSKFVGNIFHQTKLAIYKFKNIYVYFVQQLLCLKQQSFGLEYSNNNKNVQCRHQNAITAMAYFGK